jgi:hypothetical protein
MYSSHIFVFGEEITVCRAVHKAQGGSKTDPQHFCSSFVERAIVSEGGEGVKLP